MKAESFGLYLINDLLPAAYKLDGAVNKSALQAKMVQFAKADQKAYVEVIQKLKQLGDTVATLEGISVGLADIQPEYEKRDPVLKGALKRIQATNDPEERRAILIDTEEKLLAVAKTHAGDMGLMARSGGRGNIAQLMKTVASPVVSKGPDGKPVPWLISHSYAEGLRPGEAWIANDDARRGAIESTGSVVEPGAAAKVIMNNMQDLVVVKEDCGTKNGLYFSSDSPEVIDRYLVEPVAGVGTSTPLSGTALAAVRKAGSTVRVRSPLTCEIQQGVCQRCMGLSTSGQVHSIGTNVGSMSAQAISEPLTQMVLNAKHAVRTVGGNKKGLSGLAGFQVLTEVPASFNQRASLAQIDGRVDRIDKAPQGGFFVYVTGKQHYSPPGMDIIVKIGDTVEAGDALDSGVPMPNEVVKFKGIGLGREYMAQAVQDVFKNTGSDVDRRHTELLARNALQYVKIEADPSGTFIPGDTVPISRILPVIQRYRKKEPLIMASNKTLAENIGQFSVGTRLTMSVVGKLQQNGVKEVFVANGGPKYRAIMKSIVQNPTLEDDWMSRLGHRYLKRTLLTGAQRGDTSSVDSTNPITAFAQGASFGMGEGGKYGSALDNFVPEYSTDLDREEEAWDAIKEASFWNGAKRVLFGTGSHLVPADAGSTIGKLINRAQGASAGFDGHRMVAPSGAVDVGASNAERIQGWLHAAGRKDINFFDSDGSLTPDGYRKYQAIENNLPFRGSAKLDTVTGKAPDGSDLRLADNFKSVGLDLSQDDLEAFSKHRGSVLSRISRPIRDGLIGEAPLRSLTQRYNQGGLFGRGGIAFGGFSVNPDLIRQVNVYRNTPAEARTSGQRLNLGLAGINEALDKSFNYVLPAAMAYTAATSPDRFTQAEAEQAAARGIPVSSKVEQTARAVAEPFAWSAFGPTSMIGASIVPKALDAVASGFRHLDPVARTADRTQDVVDNQTIDAVLTRANHATDDEAAREQVRNMLEQHRSGQRQPR